MATERFRKLADHELDADQAHVAQVLTSGPRGGVPAPFQALLRSPDLTDKVRELGDYIRFRNSLPGRLRELVSMMATRFWPAPSAFHSHRNTALKEGLDPAIAEAVTAATRPAAMPPDETLVYDFCDQLLNGRDVKDATYDACIARFGERTVMDMVATAGYFSLISLVLVAKRQPLPEGAAPLPARRT